MTEALPARKGKQTVVFVSCGFHESSTSESLRFSLGVFKGGLRQGSSYGDKVVI